MSTQKTERPVCDCHGTHHAKGEYGCIFRTTEDQIRDGERELAEMIRWDTGVEASDSAIMRYVGLQAAAVNKSMKRKRIAQWILGSLCSLAALILAWWEITK